MTDAWASLHARQSASGEGSTGGEGERQRPSNPPGAPPPAAVSAFLKRRGPGGAEGGTAAARPLWASKARAGPERSGHPARSAPSRPWASQVSPGGAPAGRAGGTPDLQVGNPGWQCPAADQGPRS